MRNVLWAYAAYDQEVGYCQGMNFLAGLLLMYLPESEAFAALVVLMQERGMRDLYTQDMSLLEACLCFGIVKSEGVYRFVCVN